MENYDSVYGELWDDRFALNYTVAADLSISEVVEEPSNSDLHYGNEVMFCLVCLLHALTSAMPGEIPFQGLRLS